MTDKEKDVEIRLEPIPEDPEWISGLPLCILMVTLSIVMFLALLDSSIIGAATPSITNEFHSLDDVGWYGSAYQLTSAALQPLTGKLYAQLNKKWTYAIFFALFELGSLLCGASQSSMMLVIARAVAGMGVAGLQNGSMTILSCSVPLERRPSLNGILFAASQLGMVLGPILGGAFTSYASWRWCPFPYKISQARGFQSSSALMIGIPFSSAADTHFSYRLLY